MGFYTDAQRALQTSHSTRQLADAMEAGIICRELTPEHAAFIASRDFFFLSSVNAAGEPTVSHKGGGIGTVRVIDSKTLVFPAYDGNGMFLSLGNIAETAKIGLLFIDFETPNRLRVQATATLIDDDELQAQYPGAIAMVRASVDSAFVNCARYIHKHQRQENSEYVPDAQGNAPLATWKRIDGLQPHLAPQDQGRAEQEGGLISAEDYAAALAQGKS